MKSFKTVFGNGNMYYHNKHGQIHREDGPAVIWSDGSKYWYINGKCHREDGPAVILADGYKEYWLNSIWYEYEEWLDRVDNPILYKWREFCESN